MIIAPYLQHMNYKYDDQVDQFIQRLIINDAAVVSVTEYYVTLKLHDRYISIWVNNKWYGYASHAHNSTETKGEHAAVLAKLYDKKRPSRKTMIMLHNYIKDNYEDQPFELSLENIMKEGTNHGE